MGGEDIINKANADEACFSMIDKSSLPSTTLF